MDILEKRKFYLKHSEKINALYDILKRLHLLKKEGFNNIQLDEVIKKMNLPLNAHLFLTGYFSYLMEYMDSQKY